MSESAGSRIWKWLRANPNRFDLLVAVAAVGAALLLIFGAGEEFDTGWPEVVAGIGAFVLIVLRRWKPLPLLVIAVALVAIHLLVWARPTPMLFAALVLLATNAVRMQRWPAIALGVGFGTMLYVLGVIANDLSFGEARAVIGITWAAMTIGVSDAVRSWRQYRQSAEAQVRSAVLAAEAQSRQQVSEERLAIARELHVSPNTIKTQVAAIRMKLGVSNRSEAVRAGRDRGLLP